MRNIESLIVGGGIGGLAATIKLRENGHQVDLIDLDPIGGSMVRGSRSLQP